MSRAAGMKCQALDMNGRRCRSDRRLVAVSYHGSHELYGYDGPEPKWVRVYLCPKHRKPKPRPARSSVPGAGGREP
jgi:hypothetical protein